MKRFLLGVALASAALVALLGYASSRREHAYRTLIEQGDTALARGDSVSAIEAFTTAIALKPGSMLGYLRRGESYRLDGELETALKDLRTASQLDPSATRPLEVMGDVEHALRRYDRAIGRFEQYVRIDDRSPRVLYKLALSRYHRGDAAGAVDALRAAVEIDGRFAHAHYLLGLCYDTLGQPEQAQPAFQRAMELSPTLLPARERLAALHRDSSRDDDYFFQLEALQALDPASPGRHVTLGLAYADAGQTDRAVSVLARAAERFPQHGYAYVALGRVWLEAGESRSDPVALQKAIAALERAVAVERSSEALTLLGRALLAAGEPQRAAESLLAATTRRPADPLAFYFLADAADRVGDARTARDALLDYRALEGDPADDRRRGRLFARIADLSARAGDAPAAAEWFQRAGEADPSEVDASFLVRQADAQWRAGAIEAARATVAAALALEPAHRAARALARRLRAPDTPPPTPPASDRRDPGGRPPGS